jgi:putative hemolysin
MTRGALGLVSLLGALALVGGLLFVNAKQSGPTAAQSQHVEQQAQGVAAAASFGQAAIELEAFHAQTGTYLGAQLPASYAVTLVRADASSYCLQAGAATSAQHLVGPGGQPASGPC